MLMAMESGFDQDWLGGHYVLLTMAHICPKMLLTFVRPG